MKGYNHLSIIERENIAKLQVQGLSKREILRRINRSHSTVIRELSRLKEEYSPSKAQAQYISNRKNTGRKSIFQTNPEAKEYAEFKLEYDRWLPDEVANRAKLEGLYTFSTSTLYRGINSGIVNISIIDDLDEAGQVKAIKLLKSENVSGVIIHPLNSEKTKTAINDINGSGIPVIAVDSDVSDIYRARYENNW